MDSSLFLKGEDKFWHPFIKDTRYNFQTDGWAIKRISWRVSTSINNRRAFDKNLPNNGVKIPNHYRCKNILTKPKD